MERPRGGVARGAVVDRGKQLRARVSACALRAASACAALATSPRAAAQVNTEALRPQLMESGVSGTADLSVGLAKGNVDYIDIGGGLRVQLQTLRPPRADGGMPFAAQRVFVAASARYAERTPLGAERGEAFVNQLLVHARWTAMWRERFGTELFAQLQTNEFFRLRVRTLGGTGLRFEIVHEEPVQVWAGTGTMLEYNRVDVAPGAPDPSTELVNRSTSYLGVRTALRDKTLLLQLMGYVQPAWIRPKDVRTLVELEALAKVTDAFSLGNTLSVLHDSEPPTTVRPTDLRLTMTVKLTF
ncbi:MAG: DUF481 domain-containing protein [Myxococcales bacterium]|jgi:hypothetical protein|nr:DUF481 domain-containing protein [Myxococcales bacterium]MBL0195283.1 DUF481 domain-containing protein [Myxococcales bacterium]HQY60417.1 DUF481 domain-containing protein [Polyangiaceae bacterium]